LFPKTHIEINNALGGGLQAKLHCKGNMPNLGADKSEQVMNDGQSHQFGFTPSFIMRTVRVDL